MGSCGSDTWATVVQALESKPSPNGNFIRERIDFNGLKTGGQIIAKGCPKKENYWAPQAPMAEAKRAMRRSMPAGVRSAAS